MPGHDGSYVCPLLARQLKLNSTVDDRGLAPVTSRMGSAEEDFAFSRPVTLPVARIDHPGPLGDRYRRT
ncbi:hypothetical protein [Streptomyces formicae]|uniref:Uncharacterized protein n=1 Tax=Streptomyces formicae TaxID=1616117 RepID=A0ABY3WIV8_9ACTN|nr:hypothetical protein J4032_08445 [Streptomyces formicae]